MQEGKIQEESDYEVSSWGQLAPGEEVQRGPMLISDWSTNERPVASVIWLHGLGANGTDFDGVFPKMRQTNRIGIHHVVPHAPVRRITVNDGGLLRGWFDLFSLDLDAEEDVEGIRDSHERIVDLIRDEQDAGIPANRIVLAGYSQGGAMALHTGLRYPEPLAGVVCLSGYLPLPETLQAEQHHANAGTPIFMAHGTRDDVMDFGRAEQGREKLKALGHDVHWEDYPIMHEVCIEEMDALDEWLMARLKQD
ncbi:alpha/beta hydrolase [Alkalilimnicola ehrlichii MLHE-1]|uniref:Phospholipase/Carboxylesterase n=1 Tax=Alkalilimnicola ehrlichii (strain ATCC BAA-1101 / DSM 17681 / MLHE-1) TaxID=187272 RepID=Q0A9Q6_ALKEH|nr:alpha/beta hydrolase-fold protein [Alkalilimnicola ehrlichii]ABI56431.1 phospholipase/Carboxylesterase [Alkalilimnicola ehrlichii MLHE-1]